MIIIGHKNKQQYLLFGITEIKKKARCVNQISKIKKENLPNWKFFSYHSRVLPSKSTNPVL